MTGLFALALAFMRISLGAFGGGLTTLPLIHHELVTRGNWLTAETFAELVSIAQITPGPVALNAATFVGYRVAGLPGALVTTCSVLILPLLLTALIIILTAKTAKLRNSVTHRILDALAPGVAAMLFLAFFKLAGPLLPRPGLLAIAGLSLIALQFPLFRDRPPLLFLVSGLLALALELAHRAGIISQ